jgi:N-acetylglucosamine kinase-like BadF-type ATPase
MVVPNQNAIPVTQLDGARLVLGIDGGGSHTVALLGQLSGDSNGVAQIIGRGVGGPSNFQAVGREVMGQSLDQAVSEAFANAGLSRGTVAGACLGLAGAGRPADRDTVLDWATSRQLAHRVCVESDGRLLLAAGTPNDWGLGVIAGTGSFALSRLPDGRTRRAGGWGYLFGDEGSAYALALQSLQAVTRAYDGAGPETAMTELVLARLQITEVRSIVSAVYGRGLDRQAIADLASVATDAASSGDREALRCLETAADSLAGTAAAAARLFADHDVREFPVCLAGGLMTNCPAYADQLLARLRARVHVEMTPVTTVTEPAVGAVRIAQTLVH